MVQKFFANRSDFGKGLHPWYRPTHASSVGAQRPCPIMLAFLLCSDPAGWKREQTRLCALSSKRRWAAAAMLIALGK